jgi:hypothetical protein
MFTSELRDYMTEHKRRYENKSHLEILGNFPDKPLEWKLPYEQLSALLILANFTAKSGIMIRILSIWHTYLKCEQ